MPDEKSLKDGNEDDLVEILSNLGIFCKKKEVVYAESSLNYLQSEEPCAEMMNYCMMDAAPAPMPQRMAKTACRGGGRGAAMSGAAAASTASASMSRADSGGAENGAALYGAVKMEAKAADEAPMMLRNSLMKKKMMMMNPTFGATCDSVEADVCDDVCEDAVCEEPQAAPEEICLGAAAPAGDVDDADDDVEELENSNENAGTAEESTEGDGENELNQDQINDAFDVFF